MNILITGANGFVGRALCSKAASIGFQVSAVTRTPFNLHENVKNIVVENIGADTNWQKILTGIDVVIHVAARVHVMQEKAKDPLDEFRQVNVIGTEQLARSAARTGVKRFVYVSSIGVNGPYTQLPFTELDNPNPQTPYAASKFEAENFLHDFSKASGMQVVIIRPPLVYGMSAPGNFAQLISLVNKTWPLPLSSVNNLRSFIYVENLVDAIILCATHPNAAGQTYLVSDGESVSTPTFIRELSKAMGKKCLLFPFSVPVMKFFASLIGKSAAVDKLTQSLEVDDSKIRNELGWMQPYTMEQGLKATADWYLQQQK